MTSPALSTDTVAVHLGDCLTVLQSMPDASVDAVITDPPYGLSNTDPAHVVEALTRWATGDRDFVPTGRGFMGKAWDSFVPPPAVWDECYRVLKPGGHLLSFAGSRTFDLMTLSIRFAGFDIRDSIAWLYGSGFPKSLDVSKAVDKLDAVAERRSRALEFTAFMRNSGLTSQQINSITNTDMGGHYTTSASQPAIATANLFDLLRPHLPPVPKRIEDLVHQRTVESQNTKAREVVGLREVPVGHAFSGTTYGGNSTEKEYADTTAHTPEAETWSGWGTALKPAFEPIVVARKPLIGTVAANVLAHGTGGLNIDATRVGNDVITAHGGGKNTEGRTYGGGTGIPAIVAGSNPHVGRWPTNVVMDGDTADALDAEGPVTKGVVSGMRQIRGNVTFTVGEDINAKKFASTSEYVTDVGGPSRYFPTFRYQAKAPTRERPVHVAEDGTKTAHPTVKPLELMRWLVRLVTPPGGLVLDPFAGSGTTLEAVHLEGFTAVGVERDETYLPLIATRLERSANVE